MEQPNSFTRALMWLLHPRFDVGLSRPRTPDPVILLKTRVVFTQEQRAKPLRGAEQLFAENFFAVRPQSFSFHSQQQPHASHLTLRGWCPQDFHEGISWLGLDQIHQHLLGARGHREMSGIHSRSSLSTQYSVASQMFLAYLEYPSPQYPSNTSRVHPHLSSRLLVSLSSLLATGTSLLVRVREISVLLSCSAPLSPRLATFSPARAQGAVLGFRGLGSHSQSNPAQAECKERSVPMSTLLPSG